jgi:hypothetical protein
MSRFDDSIITPKYTTGSGIFAADPGQVNQAMQAPGIGRNMSGTVARIRCIKLHEPASELDPVPSQHHTRIAAAPTMDRANVLRAETRER